jgi:hypothetical protein
MDYRKYTSAGEWYEDARIEGYMPSAPMMRGITRTMEKLGISFAEAFEFLEKTKKIFLVDKLYYFNLDYGKLLDLSENRRLLLMNVWRIIDYLRVKERQVEKIYWLMKTITKFDFVKSELSELVFTEDLEKASLLITYGTQFGTPIYENQWSCLSPKYAIVLGFSALSGCIADRCFLYALKDCKYYRMPSMQIPNKQWAEYYTNVTGKLERETWLQGMFLLTEVEGFSQEEAQKFMAENWDT